MDATKKVGVSAFVKTTFFWSKTPFFGGFFNTQDKGPLGNIIDEAQTRGGRKKSSHNTVHSSYKSPHRLGT